MLGEPVPLREPAALELALDDRLPLAQEVALPPDAVRVAGAERVALDAPLADPLTVELTAGERVVVLLRERRGLELALGEALDEPPPPLVVLGAALRDAVPVARPLVDGMLLTDAGAVA